MRVAGVSAQAEASGHKRAPQRTATSRIRFASSARPVCSRLAGKSLRTFPDALQAVAGERRDRLRPGWHQPIIATW